MKKIMVLGLGAQGSTAAGKLAQEPGVSEVICADYDRRAVEALAATYEKATGAVVDASDVRSIARAARGCDLILAILPLKYLPNAMKAALMVGANYQDYSGTTELYEEWEASALYNPEEEPVFQDPDTATWYHSISALHHIYGPKFKAAGRYAMFGTGSAPGIICAATRYAMRYLDTCETIYNYVWEGVYPKRFLPFWWSPITALMDMAETAIAMEDGKLKNVPAFGDPMEKCFRGMEKPVLFRNHCHDEPMQYYYNKDTHFKGCRNAYFKYAGDGMDFAYPLYRAGLLSKKKEKICGQEISPFDLVMSRIPPAPKYKGEIQEILDEGLLLDDGCMVVEAYGTKDGKNVRVELHVNAPGLTEAFTRAEMTSEMYLTGQGGYLFTKLFVDGYMDGAEGMYSSDMLTDFQVDRYFETAAGLGITLDVTVEEI